MFVHTQDIQNFMDSFYKISYTPMFLLNDQRIILRQNESFPKTKTDIFVNIIRRDIQDRLFYLKATKCELFLIFPFLLDQTLHYFVMGPILYYQKRHTTDIHGYEFIANGDFPDPYAVLRILPNPTDTFFAYIEMVYSLLHDKKISSDELKRKFASSKILHEKEHFFNSIIQQRENYDYAYTYSDEQFLLHHIRQGNTSEAMIACAKIASGRIGRMSANQLRKSKYAVVASITLITRAVVEVGVPVHQAYSLSDTYIIKVDEEYDKRHIFDLLLDMVQDFCILVNKYKNKNYPSWVRKCMEYIDLHLHEEITLTDLAQLVHMNEAYISVQFKKMRGESIKEYLNKQRIREAKYLLLTTDLSIQEISTQLCFTDQSYFSKVFKRYSSVLPTIFRSHSIE